jgi:hypothetical protein
MGLLREVAQQPIQTVHPSAEEVQVQFGNYIIKRQWRPHLKQQ